MEDRLLDKVAEPFNLQLPEYDSMEAMLDGILPALKSASRYRLPTEADDDVTNNPLYHNNWVRLSDTPGDTQVVLYNFQFTGNIRIATDGEISSSSFDIDSAYRMTMGDSPHRGAILYDLVFLNNDYFILARHGNANNFKRKYVAFCTEAIGRRLSWSEALERLVAQHHNTQFPYVWLLAFVAIVAGLLYFLT